MTKVRRTITLSAELDEAISMLAASKSMNYSEFLESRLRTVAIIQQMITELEELPEMPIINTGRMQASSKTPTLVTS